MLTMSEKQSHNRVQLWHHFDVTSNIEDCMKSNIISQFSLARCRRKKFIVFDIVSIASILIEHLKKEKKEHDKI